MTIFLCANCIEASLYGRTTPFNGIGSTKGLSKSLHSVWSAPQPPFPSCLQNQACSQACTTQARGWGPKWATRKDLQMLLVRGLSNHPTVKSITLITQNYQSASHCLTLECKWLAKIPAIWKQLLIWKTDPNRTMGTKRPWKKPRKCKKQRKEKPAKDKMIHNILREIKDDITSIRQEQNDIKGSIQRTKKSS